MIKSWKLKLRIASNPEEIITVRDCLKLLFKSLVALSALLTHMQSGWLWKSAWNYQQQTSFHVSCLNGICDQTIEASLKWQRWSKYASNAKKKRKKRKDECTGPLLCRWASSTPISPAGPEILHLHVCLRYLSHKQPNNQAPIVWEIDPVTMRVVVFWFYLPPPSLSSWLLLFFN